MYSLNKISRLLIFLVMITSASHAQTATPVIRNNGVVTAVDLKLWVSQGLKIPVFIDTTHALAAAQIDSIGLLFKEYSTSRIWVRDSNLVAGGHVWTLVGTGGGTADDSTLMQTKYRSDTSRANIYADLSGKQPAGSYLTAPVANSSLATMAAGTIKGNNTGSTANAADLTPTQVTAMLNLFTTTLQGMVPAPATISGKVLSDNGTWVAQSGGVTQTALNDTAAAVRTASADSIAAVRAALIDSTTKSFNLYVQRSSGRGDSLLHGYQNFLRTPGIVDSGAFHHYVNPDSSWTLYVASGGGSADTANLNIRIDTLATRLNTVQSTQRYFHNDRTDPNSDSLLYAPDSSDLYVKGVIDTSDATMTFTKSTDAHTVRYSGHVNTTALGTGLTAGQHVTTDPATNLLSTQAEILHQPVLLATAAALPSNTYSNGTAGVGATLTGTANAALTVDGVAVATGNRILVKNEAALPNNAIYTVTQPGSGSTPYILTRGSYSAIAGNLIAGSHVYVQSGTANINTVWYQQTTGPVTIGTTSLVYAQTAGTNKSVGSGIKVAIDGTNNIKTLIAGQGQLIDTTSVPGSVILSQQSANLPAFYFNPAFIPGLVAWYDASDFSTVRLATSSTTAVDTLVDKSGNGYNLAAGTTPPTYIYRGGPNNNPYISFPEGASLINASIAVSQPYTLYIVVAQNEFVNHYELANFGSSTNGIIQAEYATGYPPTITVAANTNYVNADALNQHFGYNIYKFQVNGSSTNVQNNEQLKYLGYYQGTQNPGSSPIIQMILGQSTVTNPSYNFEEMILVSGLPSDALDKQIRDYLQVKYGLANNDYIAWFGDSITAGSMLADHDSCYAYVVTSSITDMDYYNYGIPGTSVWQGSQSFLYTSNYLRGGNNGWAVIGYGTNDYTGGSGFDSTTWRENYEATIDRLINYGYSKSKIIVTSPPFQPSYPTRAGEVATLTQLAADKGIIFADVYNYTKTNGCPLLDTEHPNGTCNQTIATFLKTFIH